MPSQQQREPSDQGTARRGPAPLLFEQFQGVNTATTRAGVPDQMAYWLDGFMPLAPRNLRTLPGKGAAVYTAGAGITIICFYFYNIKSDPFAVVFLSDGSAVQINTATTATATVLPAGTIIAPAVTSIGVSQYGQQYLLIVANQANGYWVWDGSVLYGAGTLAPQVTLTNVGSGYTGVPTVTASGGSGSGATFGASVNNGQVTNITISNAGSGYKAGDTVTININGAQSAGTGATFTANMVFNAGGSGATATANWTLVNSSGGTSYWSLTSITITNGGSGYLNPTAFFVNGTGGWTNGTPALAPFGSTGVLSGVNITNPPGGTSYKIVGAQALPTIGFGDTGAWSVSTVTVNTQGSGYSPSTTLSVTGGGTPIYQQATLTPVISGGQIISVTVNSGGFYGTSTPPSVAAVDITVAATATAHIMPFGVSGTAVKAYQGYVWVVNGALINHSAPGSVWDFGTSDGGGSATSADPFLKVGYSQIVSTVGFLLLIGDSSMNYISGVQTNTPSGGNPTTTYTNNNSDPEQGTPYPAAVLTDSENIIIANSTGVYLSPGGAPFTKVSQALDGVWGSVPNFNGEQISGAKATIFARRVWMFLLPIVDPVGQVTVRKLLMFNGKEWWASFQDTVLNFIQGQEINSVYTAWGTDGTTLFRLFQTPSAGFLKVAQSRLWDAPAGYDHTKSAVNWFAITQFFNVSVNNSYEFSVDNENGNGPFQAIVATQLNTSQTFNVSPPQSIGQWGALLGFTFRTSCPDLVLVSAAIQPEIVGYRA